MSVRKLYRVAPMVTYFPRDNSNSFQINLFASLNFTLAILPNQLLDFKSIFGVGWSL